MGAGKVDDLDALSEVCLNDVIFFFLGLSTVSAIAVATSQPSWSWTSTEMLTSKSSKVSQLTLQLQQVVYCRLP
jgi:hypothetical protein